MTSAPARDAATVILAREGTGGIEVLLMRRPAKASFFGGAYVFPGGAVEPADHGEGIRAHLGPAGIAAAGRVLGGGDGAFDDGGGGGGVGLVVAAFREVFEECGVLLAVDDDGAPWAPRGAAERSRLEDLRARLHAGALPFAEVLALARARLDPGVLRLWAHWITPSVERKRFDTRFFVAPMPVGQEVSVDSREAVDARWGSPRALLDASEAGDIALPPPTFRNLEELSGFAQPGPGGFWERLQTRAVVPIQPKIGSANGAIAILLPWDPAYPQGEGEELASVVYPRAYTEGPSRIVLEQGRWVSRRG